MGYLLIQGTASHGPAGAVVGCDPGFTGGIAVLGRSAPALYRMPLLRQKKHAYDIEEMRNLLDEAAPCVRSLLIIERVTRPASLTRCMGILEGLGAALDYDVVTVRPAVWKHHYGLTADKSLSIKLAHRLYPSTMRTITKASDDGLAEALILAHYGKTVIARTVLRIIEKGVTIP